MSDSLAKRIGSWVGVGTGVFARRVSDIGTAQSSYGDVKTCVAAPAAGAQVQAFAAGSTELRAKNGSATAGEYVIIGFGESEAAAEANRDGTNMLVVLAGESWEDRKSTNETHYAWKSATGTPLLWLGEGA
jgi:hypothetical protein